MGVARGHGLSTDVSAGHHQHLHHAQVAPGDSRVEWCSPTVAQRQAHVQIHHTLVLLGKIQKCPHHLPTPPLAGIEERCAAQPVPKVEVQLLARGGGVAAREPEVVEEEPHHVEVTPRAGHVERGESVCLVRPKQQSPGVIQEECRHGNVATATGAKQRGVPLGQAWEGLTGRLGEKVLNHSYGPRIAGSGE